MNATELYQKGQLQEAIDAQIQAVKSKPADQSLRLFLFELLCFSGEVERALKQVDALKYDDPELVVAVGNYRLCLASELARRKVFKEGVAPLFPKDPPEHLKLRLEALQQIRTGDLVGAKATLDKAEAVTPVTKGLLNDKPFEGLRDCDDLFGPVIEVFAKGNYFWVPLEQVEAIALNPPKFPRDLLWAPANLQIREGPTADVLLPTLYPSSHESSDPQIKLGRLTDWNVTEGGPALGIGSHLFLNGEDAISVLEWRQLVFV